VGGECCQLGRRNVEVGRLGPQNSIVSNNCGVVDETGIHQLFVDVILPAHDEYSAFFAESSAKAEEEKVGGRKKGDRTRWKPATATVSYWSGD